MEDKTKTASDAVAKHTKGGGGQSFGSAFKSARKSGKKIFSYNGKSYNTNLKSAPKKKVPAKKIVKKTVSKQETKNQKFINKTVVKKEKAKSGSGLDFVKVPKKTDPAKIKSTGKIRQPWFNKKKEGPKSVTLTEGGAYATYKKKSKAAKSFRSAFSDASKSGKKTFSWDGRSYSTKKANYEENTNMDKATHVFEKFAKTTKKVSTGTVSSQPVKTTTSSKGGKHTTTTVHKTNTPDGIRYYSSSGTSSRRDIARSKANMRVRAKIVSTPSDSLRNYTPNVSTTKAKPKKKYFWQK